MKYERLKTKLLEKINLKREEMIETATREGYTSETAVKCSQDLDMLLNEYQQMIIDEEKPTKPLYQFMNQMKILTYNEQYL
ncbi:aspartyl-phosphate phosphatase Spo0E family protein [Metabacillus sp. HB246100]|uniref:aspartyl-phosphate phosphatase Spo0E family protein n=1 Tax=Bacillus weihaiensis TaxID=1547283 RepID=UPI0023532DE2|nr:aspartyl-phosphate phosphatase Spo0E family protein [Bacillus weihaiensis]